MGVLYLCEKPDQGRAIAKGLGGGSDHGSHIECGGDVVTWGYGHLLSAFEPEDYNPALKAWDWATLPILPAPFQYKPNDARAAKQLRLIADLSRGKAEIIISTDADREGELIAYLILDHIRWRGPLRRLWLSDLTKPAVEKALGALLPATKTRPLYLAALARSKADWIVGYGVTRGASLKFRAPDYRKPLSIGRVQTPTLALIVRNERKILRFTPQDYHEILAEVLTANGHRLIMRHAPAAEHRLFDAAEAQRRIALVQGAQGPLAVKTEAKTQAPPSLFDLNLLQQEANSRFGWSGKKTLEVAQKLYEKHHFLTYPRTDSTALPEEHTANIPLITANLARIPELAGLAPLLAHPIARPSVYDTKAVKSHHAIVPTVEPPDPAVMDADEARLYALVARRWVAAHLPDHGYMETVITLDARGVELRTAGRVPTVLGWKEAMRGEAAEDEEEKAAEAEEAGGESIPDKALPPVQDGEAAHVSRVKDDIKTTKPPRRFTEKSLLRAMKDIASYVDDPAARASLRKASGIGTSATRASIIETLKTREYIEVKKRLLVPTAIGMALVAAMEAAAAAYCDPAETAQWEDGLEDIAEGRAAPDPFVQKISDRVRRDLDLIRNAAGGGTIGTGGGGGKAGPPRPAFASMDDRAAAVRAGTALRVPFDKKDKAKALGAAWDADRRCWVLLPGMDPAPFKRAKFL